MLRPTDKLVTATDKTTTNQLVRSNEIRLRATQTAASIEPNHTTFNPPKMKWRHRILWEAYRECFAGNVWARREHSPRHFLRNCCYSFPLSSIHASPKHWTFRDLTCRTRQELHRPARQGLVRWHCLTAPHSDTAPSRAEKRFDLFRLYALH